MAYWGGCNLEVAFILTAKILIVAGLLDLALLVTTSVGVAAAGLSHARTQGYLPSRLRGWMVACILLMAGSAIFLAVGPVPAQRLSILPDGLLSIQRMTAAVVLFISTGTALIFNLQSQRVFALQNTFNAAPVMGLHLLACCLAILSGNLLVIAAAWIFISAAHHLQTSYPDGQLIAPLVAWRRWLISIIGDCGFILVAALLATAYGSTHIRTIYYHLSITPDSFFSRRIRDLVQPLLITVIFIKCAQFPFSFWLIPSRRDNTSWLNLQLSCGAPLVAILVFMRLEPMLTGIGGASHILPGVVNWAVLSAGIYSFAGGWQTDRFKAAFFMGISSVSLLLILIGSGERLTAEWGMMILFSSIFILLFGLMLSAPLNRRPFFPSRRPGYRSPLATVLIVCGAINLSITPGFSASITIGRVFADLAGDRLSLVIPDVCALWLVIVFNTVTAVRLIAWSLRGRPIGVDSGGDQRPTAANLPPPKPSIISTSLLLAISVMTLFSCSLNVISSDSLGPLLPAALPSRSVGGPASLTNPAVSMALGASATVAGLIVGVFIQMIGKAGGRSRLAKMVPVRQAVLLLLTAEQFAAGALVALIWAAGRLVALVDRFGLESFVSLIGIIPHMMAAALRAGMRSKGWVRTLLLALGLILTLGIAAIAAALTRAAGR